MKTMIKPLALATAMIAASTSTQVMALEAGDWIFRSGLTTVAANEDSSEPTLNGSPIGGEVSVENDTQLGITIEYMLSPNLGVELLAATPFEHTVKAKGGTLGNTLGLDEIADVKQLPPTLSLNYHFNPQGNFQPYIGLGLNYTVFFSEDASGELEAAAGDTDVELDNSFGLAAQVGFDYHINDQWLFNGSVRYMDIDTEAEVDTTALGVVDVDVDIDPYVYSLSVGYKF